MNIIYRAGLSLLFILFATAFTVDAQSVMDRLRSDEQISEFTQALESANLDTKLQQEGPFTIFAPSNSAFSKLSNVQQSNRSLLLNHIFTGMATKRSLGVMTNITCLSGKTVEINKGNSLSVNGNSIIKGNIKTQNGVIHIIDGVID